MGGDGFINATARAAGGRMLCEDSESRPHPMRVSRRTFLKSAGVLALASSGCVHVPSVSKRTLVNDVQSRLNATYVDGVIKVRTLGQLRSTIGQAADSGKPVGLC